MANLEFAAILISVLVLAFIVYFPWQQACIDVARNQIFEARDKLFDLAIDGHIRIDDDNYIKTREEYNNIIRFAHHISWPRLIAYGFVFKRYGRTSQYNKKQLPRTNSVLTNKQIAEIDRTVYYATMRLLFSRSPILVTIYLGGLLWRESGGRPPEFLRRLFDSIRTEANDFENREVGWSNVVRAG